MTYLQVHISVKKAKVLGISRCHMYPPNVHNYILVIHFRAVPLKGIVGERNILPLPHKSWIFLLLSNLTEDLIFSLPCIHWIWIIHSLQRRTSFLSLPESKLSIPHKFIGYHWIIHIQVSVFEMVWSPKYFLPN